MTEFSLPGRRIGGVSTCFNYSVPDSVFVQTVHLSAFTQHRPSLLSPRTGPSPASPRDVSLFACPPQHFSLCFLPASSLSPLSPRIDPLLAIPARRPFAYFTLPLLPKATLSLLLHPHSPSACFFLTSTLSLLPLSPPSATNTFPTASRRKWPGKVADSASELNSFQDSPE